MKSHSPSATARLIAAATILLSHRSKEGSLVPKAAINLCRVFLGVRWQDRLLRTSVDLSIGRQLWNYVESVVLPGIVCHYWLRKRLIEKLCRERLEKSATHCIVLGAGLDTLALRLEGEYPAVKFSEYDHAATQALKCQAIKHSETNTKIEFNAIDLESATEYWPSLKVDSGSQLVVIAEGLLMYFTARRVAEILSWIANQRNVASVSLIATYMEKVDDLPIGFRPRSSLVDWWLSGREESFKWAEPPVRLKEFLASQGYDLEKQVTSRELAGEVGFSELKCRLKGENVFLARYSTV